MWNTKVSYTFVFSIFANQIICDLITKKDGNVTNLKSEGLYQKKDIDRTIIVRPLPPPFTAPPLFKPQPPVFYTLGVPNAPPNLPPNGIPNGVFNPYEMFLPLDYISNYRNSPTFNNHGLNPELNSGLNSAFGPGVLSPGPGPGLFQGLGPNGHHGLSNLGLKYESGDGKSEPFENLLNYLKHQLRPNSSPSEQQVQYFKHANQNDESLNEEKPDAGPPNEDHNIQILKSLTYALPSEITYNHPVSYANEYFLDLAASDSVRNMKHSPKLKSKDLLTGEEMSEKEEILAEVESKMKETLNKLEAISTNFPNQYYYSNRKPITFENIGNKSNPRNIYEILNVEKITPREVEMTEEELRSLKNMTKASEQNKTTETETGNKHGGNKENDKEDSLEAVENEETNEYDTDKNLVVDEKRNSKDDDLRVLDLEKKEDKDEVK